MKDQTVRRSLRSAIYAPVSTDPPGQFEIGRGGHGQTATLETEICGQDTFGKTRQELPLRIAGPPVRPVLGEASYGNVVLSCAVGNHVDLRGLPGGAEGIRTSDLRSAGTRARR